jgi:mannose-6-phosphate isomerase-like protein (cupin superfamily)
MRRGWAAAVWLGAGLAWSQDAAKPAAPAVVTAAQDAAIAAPGNYRVDFSNDRVRVVHVHYGPQERVPLHSHPGLPMLWVYLNDAGPVKFKHVEADGGTFSVTRAPVHTGDLRIGAGHEPETHSVRNMADTPTDFLRIELLGLEPGAKGLHGKYADDGEVFRAESGRVVAFDNPKLQVIRWGIAAGQTRRLDDPAATLWVAVSPQGATVKSAAVQAGQVWAAGPLEVTAGARPAEFLEVVER